MRCRYNGIRPALAQNGTNGVAHVKICSHLLPLDQVDAKTKNAAVKILTWTQALALFVKHGGASADFSAAV